MPSLILADAASSWTLVLIVLIVYFFPTMLGRSRAVTNLGSVFVINLFLGWTLIGWVVALAMASRSSTVPRAPRVRRQRSPDRWW